MRFFLFGLFNIFLLLQAWPLAGEENSFSVDGSIAVRRRIDWLSGNLFLRTTMAPAGLMTPKTRYETERAIAGKLQHIFLMSTGDIALDSTHLIGDRLKEDPRIEMVFQELSQGGVKDAASFSSDMAAVNVDYVFPLYGEDGFVTPFITHKRPFPLRRVLGFVPNRAFSGLVIYAKGEYPLFGTSRKVKVRRALFPRLYDEEMNIVVEKIMCDPDTLERWGMVTYSDSPDIKRFSPRIGSFPLLVQTRGIFGVKNTDIILPKESADRLLALEENRNLLIQGKILIITD